jgi:hypothetical protein
LKTDGTFPETRVKVIEKDRLLLLGTWTPEVTTSLGVILTLPYGSFRILRGYYTGLSNYALTFFTPPYSFGLEYRMVIAVFGGSGSTGFSFIRKAIEAGIGIRALVRHKNSLPENAWSFGD